MFLSLQLSFLLLFLQQVKQEFPLCKNEVFFLVLELFLCHHLLQEYKQCNLFHRQVSQEELSLLQQLFYSLFR